MHTETTDTRKITAYVPKDLLHAAQQATGEGITETIRRALERVAQKESYDRLLTFRNSYKPSISLDALREDR